MKNQLFLVFFLFTLFHISAQEGTVSGILKADSDGLPLPGVAILIKGTNIGTQTDIDGAYSIKCRVGDVLIYSFISLKTREVKVTASMFRSENEGLLIKKIPVETISTDAYANAIISIEKAEVPFLNIEISNKHYNKGSYFEFNRIKDIDVKDNNVKLTYFKPDIYYEVGFTATTGIQFIKKLNLSEIQTTFSQGTPLNGVNTFLGAETDNSFSYGPALNTLEFDGSEYLFDSNGRLVPLGNGSGLQSISNNNRIFNTSFKVTNNVYADVSTNSSFIKLNFTNSYNRDLYNREQSKLNDIDLSFKKNSGSDKLNWTTNIRYLNKVNNQPNINGFQNNLLLNLLATPISFNNNQGDILPNNSQRSFNSSDFNNPIWLLNNNRNSEENNFFVAQLHSDISINENLNILSKINYSYNEDIQQFGVTRNTVGFESGFASDKSIVNTNFNTFLNLGYQISVNDSDFKISSSSIYNHNNVDFSFSERNGFNDFSFNNPQNTNLFTNTINRNTLNFNNSLNYTYLYNAIHASFINNSYISSIQKNKWFLPTFQVKVNLEELLGLYGIRELSISAISSKNVNESPLYYINKSHNGLNLEPTESLSYTTNNDLFLDETIELEEKNALDLTAKFSLRFLTFEASYFNSKTKGSVFPVFNNNTFRLDNVANIRSSGTNLSIGFNTNYSETFRYDSSITFSTYRTKVLKLSDNRTIIPIAGFSTISKNLIKGQPAGVIIGSAFARDSNQNIIIDNQGFPIVNTQSQIIGDPTPDFNLGISNNFKWKQLELSFIVDFQSGGDIWNGTQSVLNYLGTSEKSARDRSITNFVFDGVNQQGEPNTVPVDFANPVNGLEGNRFVRYGFEGIAEEAIVDGSYINLKSISLKYNFNQNSDNKFFREFNISLYALNLFTWSKFSGASPYSSFFNTTSGRGLNFFNSPITTEIGLKINLKL